MRVRRRLVALFLAAAAIVAVVFAAQSHRLRSPHLGPLRTTPTAARISVRVGESARFSAAADGATGFTWTVWGRRVASGAEWSYVPGPEDAGWQQVAVEARGRQGLRVARVWDVGVVAPVVPELGKLTPPAGRISLPPGERASFHCTARLPAARSSDRLSFEWTLDGRTVLYEQHPAAEAASELLLPRAEAGSHRLRVSVTEDGRTASLADWTIDVRSAEPESVKEAAVPPPPPPPDRPAPALAAAPRLVPVPGPRRLEATLGEAMAFQTRMEPERADASYRWSVDGRPSPRSRGTELEYRPGTPGRHRVAVVAEVDGRVVGRDAWIVAVRQPEPPATEAAAPPPERPTTEAVAAAPAVNPEPSPPAPAALADADVRRWLDEYARAWSRKDVDALRRMGQVRGAAQAARLTRYFQTIDEMQVDVHVLELHVDAERASVEFERIDTVTDRSGRRQRFHLPPVRKEIERTPEGLRFADHDGEG